MTESQRPFALAGSSWLRDSERSNIAAVYRSKSACFSDLVELSGLNPSVDFRFADLTGVDFAGSDLRGYNFVGANLSYTSWKNATWDTTTNLESALLTGAKGYETSESGEVSEDQSVRSLRGLSASIAPADERSNSERVTAEAVSAAMMQMAEAHRRTLDQLSSGVAVFDAQRRLTFYNDSYRRLWDLDQAFLDGNPDDSSVLDRLRAGRKLPEQPDFRGWKAKLHEAYRVVEPQKDTWYLPDGRALTVATTRNSEGGVTYLFDDVTESLELARRFDGLIRVQRETLDNLTEAVAVFGSNGRAQLFNPAFARIWKLSPEALGEQPHIDTVETWCRPLFDDVPIWRIIREAVTRIESRIAVPLKLERKDGSVLDCMTMPLPDGATMLTFHDITDAENVERALRERNEALETADQMKVDFVHHVSSELRSPLTTIVGFAHLLNDPSTGPLVPKQAEYLNYITTSTNSLFALINNILDLAAIDAGAVTLELGPVDIRKAIDNAAEGIQDRLARDRIELKIEVDPNIGTFVADGGRVVQVLYNLLANAVGFSPQDSAIKLRARRTDHHVVFAVTDRGPGIPPEVKDKVFDWFESRSNGSRHRGTGLGLPLVRSFVELHGGTVCVASEVGNGTVVTCEFPVSQAIIDPKIEKDRNP
jgi:signal transduction histidine kinase